MMTLERRLQLLKTDNKVKGYDGLDIADVIDSVYEWIADADAQFFYDDHLGSVLNEHLPR
jgi:hypothetical protein